MSEHREAQVWECRVIKDGAKVAEFCRLNGRIGKCRESVGRMLGAAGVFGLCLD